LLTLREEHKLRVFENRVLRRVFGPKRDEVTREWRKLHNEELNDWYSFPNIIRVIKSRRMRWVGHVACIGGVERCIQVFGGGNIGERDHFEDPGVPPHSFHGRVLLQDCCLENTHTTFLKLEAMKWH